MLSLQFRLLTIFETEGGRRPTGVSKIVRVSFGPLNADAYHVTYPTMSRCVNGLALSLTFLRSVFYDIDKGQLFSCFTSSLKGLWGTSPCPLSLSAFLACRALCRLHFIPCSLFSSSFLYLTLYRWSYRALCRHHFVPRLSRSMPPSFRSSPYLALVSGHIFHSSLSNCISP